MNKTHSFFFLLFVLAVSARAFASPVDVVEPEALLARVIDDPKSKAEGPLSGVIAKNLQVATHSKATPRIKFENLGKTGDCFKINQTLTVPDVPDTSGKIVGDWVMVTRLNICKDNKLPAGMLPQQPVSCSIGGKQCPPPSPASR